MKRIRGKRILAMALTLCLILSLIPVHFAVEAEAVSGVNSLTCSGFISNSIARKYIDTMMRYYINNNSNLQTTLNNGLSVVFMFEGGSDNYWSGSTYQNVLYSTRNQAVVIVVQLDSKGNAYIPFYSENCSSVPDDPDWCTYNVGNYQSTTLMDGIYSFYTWNHTGPYAAFQISASSGYYTPPNYPNGQVLGASGINIHTRNLNNCGGKSVGWCRSAGCQLIGSGYDTSNVFNQFMKVVAGITWNSWINYSTNTYNTWATTGTHKGYYVVDRQLGMMGTDGTQYGAGSLINLYNSTALKNIAAKSTTARNKAGFSMDYKDQCTRYASYCTLEVTYDGAELRTLPCSEGSDEDSTLIENRKPGDTLTAVGLYKNLYGNYWYEVLTSGGDIGYIYAGNVAYKGDIISDITLTGATYPNGHVYKTAFYVNGTIASKYNELTSVACYVYKDFGITDTPAIGASDKPTSNTYQLLNSKVDDDTWMATIPGGNYTYCLYASYINYYATDATTLKSNSGTLTLAEEYFAVISEAVNQSTCSHNNTTHVLTEGGCTSDRHTVTVCSICGLLNESVTRGAHSYGEWIQTKAPTCTEVGTLSRTCTACGHVESQDISVGGHSYSCVTHPATCKEYERFEYTCDICGDHYSVYADEMMSQWLETKPESIEAGKIETKTQYRYSDYKTITSYTPNLAGHTLLSKQWEQSETGTVKYVTGWHTGFDTGNRMYATYNNTKKTASETATSKTEVGSDKLIGYIYWHWCRGSYANGPINRTTSQTQDSTHTTFHAFFGTTDPSTLTTAPDTSVTLPTASCCTDSHWYYNIPVYEQSYTTYRTLFRYGHWTDYSEWSDTVYTAGETRKVETRTLYRYTDAQLGEHSWVDGVCSICGAQCEHRYQNRVCITCGMAEPIQYYLFGYINGANYACEEDYTNLGIYGFVGETLTVTFTQDSYVAVKTGDNSTWYMTNGWLGYNRTSATLYDTSILGTTADKLFVPGGVEVTFTLKDNYDGSLVLSYETKAPAVKTPTISLKYPTLSFEDEILMNVYFAATELDSVEEVGLITYSSKVSPHNVDNAQAVIPGYTYSESAGLYYATTQGIAAKCLGDTIHFAVYARLSDGSYTYTSLVSYSPKTYAYNQLKTGKVEQRPLVVAMLNYGAAAQTYFGYHTDALVNGSLTAAQKALVQNYNSTMIDSVVPVDSRKVGEFVNSNGFSKRYPTISFEGAFSINYYFVPSSTPTGKVVLYYWNQSAYNSATILTAANATGRVITTQNENGEYQATVEGIAAKDLDGTIYVSAGYPTSGGSLCSGVLAYSIGSYCVSQAAKATPLQPFAAATAVYGYYAKQYFYDAV